MAMYICVLVNNGTIAAMVIFMTFFGVSRFLVANYKNITFTMKLLSCINFDAAFTYGLLIIETREQAGMWPTNMVAC